MRIHCHKICTLLKIILLCPEDKIWAHWWLNVKNYCCVSQQWTPLAINIFWISYIRLLQRLYLSWYSCWHSEKNFVDSVLSPDPRRVLDMFAVLTEVCPCYEHWETTPPTPPPVVFLVSVGGQLGCMQSVFVHITDCTDGSPLGLPHAVFLSFQTGEQSCTSRALRKQTVS